MGPEITLIYICFFPQETVQLLDPCYWYLDVSNFLLAGDSLDNGEEKTLAIIDTKGYTRSCTWS